MSQTLISTDRWTDTEFVHRVLESGVEFAADLLPERQTVSIHFRVLSGTADEPDELGGIAGLVEEMLPKGTKRFDGRKLADEFDMRGIKWGGSTGRQSTLFRVLCLPEFVHEAVELIAELLCAPTFPKDKCAVAIDLAKQSLRRLRDEPEDVLRMISQRQVFGPRFGRWGGGTLESLERIDREKIEAHWKRTFAAGRLQVCAAGPIEADAFADLLDQTFADFGGGATGGRENADFTLQPGRVHESQKLEQEYICISLPGAARGTDDFAREQVLIGVLSGGMSGRLFTEVREKLGLVYSVAAWHEQPRGKGVMHLSASTTPERCEKTFETLLRELARLSKDLTEVEVERAKNAILAHAQTEDDLTRARGATLSDDLFHFGKPVGIGPRLAAIQAVSLKAVRDYAARLQRDKLCVATVGEKQLS